ncbi:MAG: ABC transporter substrate-binding protein [Gemmatimonadaceae bacterium]|nr:ABC transporter substrate-binding protein [Acetobacteraceae bacterium]
MTHTMRAALFASGLLLATPLHAQTPALTIAVSAPVTSIDPHYHNLTPNLAMARHIFTGLTDTDDKAKVVPGLAESWRLIDDSTWEFKLRTDARFHDGTPFVAQDVAFTLDRVPKVLNSPSSYSIYTRPVVAVEVVDAHTVRLRTNGVYPLLPNDLSQVMMLSHTIHAGMATEDFNSGRAAIGTGPYKLVAYRPGDRIELERNEAYWGAKPAWARVTTRIISNNAGRTAALLAGDVQVIDNVPTTDAAKLRTDSRVAISEVVGLRIVFLALDHMRDGPTPFVTGPNGEKLERNPLRDVRVRQALSMAINRPAIAERVMEGAAVASGQFLPVGSFGYVPGLDAPKWDAARARQLLNEAGYPGGLRITLHGPNDRYINDATIIQTIGQMWSRAGITTAVEPAPWTTFVSRAGKQEFSAFLVGWASATGEGTNPLRSLVATYETARGFGVSNRGRYSNPAMDALLTQALTTADDAAREPLIQQATRLAMDDVGIIPIHIQKNVWGMRPNLQHTPRVDEETRAMDIRPK